MRIPVSHLRRFHATATLTWVLLALPTVFWWRDSILWVALMSVWANVAGHFAGWQGARAEQANDHST
jgi:hypothetical protein